MDNDSEYEINELEQVINKFKKKVLKKTSHNANQLKCNYTMINYKNYYSINSNKTILSY